MKNRKNTQPVFELVTPDIEDTTGHCSQHGMFGPSAFFLGGGKENYEFAPNAVVLARALEEAASPDFALPELPFVGHRHGHEVNVAAALYKLDELTFPVPQCKCFVPQAAPIAKVTPERQAAHDLATVMIEGMFGQPVWAFFERDRKTLLDAQTTLPREYWELAESLLNQLEPTKAQVLQVLPELMSELTKQHPEASTGQVYQAALSLIGRQLAPILSTIQMWTTGFRQSLDPDLAEDLKIARAMIEQSLWLTLTGNLKLNEMDQGDIKQVIPTINVSVGDVVLPVIIGAFDSGPAVIPMASGALGPRGGHLCFLPWNLRPVLPAQGPIYEGHEAGHVKQAIIGTEDGHVMQGIVGKPAASQKYMPAIAQLTAKAIAEAVADKTLVFDEPTVAIGNQQVPADKFWTMVFIGQLPESDADNWGMRTNGSMAFIKSFALYVGAMTEVAVGGMDKVDHVLRTGSSYTLVQGKDGKVGIKLEPHPQDVTRIGSWQAALADELGYPEAAAYARKFATDEGGNPTPTRITWKGEMPEPEDGEDSLVARPAARKTRTKKTGTGDGATKPTRTRSPRKAPTKTDGDTSGQKRAPKADSGSKGKGGASTKRPTKPEEPQLPVISGSIADFDRVARVVVKKVLRAKGKDELPCLNGMSMTDLVDLTPKMHEEKVLPLVDILKLEDQSAHEAALDKFFSDGRHHFLLHVTSASVLALFDLIEGGMDATEARLRVMPRAKAAMLKLIVQWDADKARLDVYKLTAEDVQPDTTK